MQAVPKALPQTADKPAGNGGFVSILYHGTAGGFQYSKTDRLHGVSGHSFIELYIAAVVCYFLLKLKHSFVTVSYEILLRIGHRMLFVEKFYNMKSAYVYI